MENKKVSLIVPCYNKELYIEKCIGSLLNQTHKNIEVILIDDGSTDKSQNVYSKFIDKRFKIYRQKNQGVSSARNKGIEKATGEYITFIDADDWLEQSYVTEMLNKILELKTELVICGMKEIEGKIVEEIPFNLCLSKLDDRLFNSCGNKLFNTEIIRKNKIKFLKNIHSCEDLNFVLKYLSCLKSNETSFDKKPLYIYNRNLNSVTKNREREEKALNEILEAYEDAFEFLEQKNLNYVFKKKLNEISEIYLTTLVKMYITSNLRVNFIYKKLNEFNDKFLEFVSKKTIYKLKVFLFMLIINKPLVVLGYKLRNKIRG